MLSFAICFLFCTLHKVVEMKMNTLKHETVVDRKIYIVKHNYIRCTVKPLYSEQSRDPNKCSLYGGVHPRGVRYVHAQIQCTHIKTD